MSPLKIYCCLLLLPFSTVNAQHINTHIFYGDWKLGHVEPLELSNDYFIHEKTEQIDTTYRGLALQHIDSKHVRIKHDNNTQHDLYSYQLKEKKGQHAQLKLSGKHHLGTIFVHYLDADSMVLRHFYIDSTQHPQAFYCCYSRADDKFKMFTAIKNKLMEKWWFCGPQQGFFEKDSIVLLSTSRVSDSCKTNRCQQTSLDFNRDEFGLELDVLTKSYCAGETDKLVSGTSYLWKMYADNTVGVLLNEQKEITYQPIFRNNNVLVLRKKQ